MFWFKHYRFLHSEPCGDPRKCLVETLQHDQWQRINCNMAGDRVILQHAQARYLHNYWNPIFEGRFIIEGGRHYIVGYFRPSWLLFILNFIVTTLAALRLLTVFIGASAASGHAENWANRELVWQASFLAGLVSLMLLGWLIGVPFERRMLAAIRESVK